MSMNLERVARIDRVEEEIYDEVYGGEDDPTDLPHRGYQPHNQNGPNQ